MTRPLAAAVVLLAAAGTAGPAEPPPRAGPFQRGDPVVIEDELVRSRVDAAAAELRFRGVVRVEHDGTVLVEEGYGGRDPASAFWVASVSKSFTAVLVLRLRELGKLRLEDPVARFLPGAPAAARDITVDDLLKHTSGLPRATYEAEGVADAGEAVRRILALPRGARGRFAYTNDGYALLAIVAEHAGGAPFQDLLRREVLARAGLAHTGFWPRCVPGLPVAPLARPPVPAPSRAMAELVEERLPPLR